MPHGPILCLALLAGRRNQTREKRGCQQRQNHPPFPDVESVVDPPRPQGLPGVFFFYDLSPIRVTFRETRTSFLHFLTVKRAPPREPIGSVCALPRRPAGRPRCTYACCLPRSQGVCAIVGGMFTVAGLVDSTVYHGQKMAAKMSMGKQA